jgi:hypothetical protein
MFRIFSSLAVFGLLMFVGEAVLGFCVGGNPARMGNHMLVGVFVAIYFCALHSLTMFHLIGTSKDTKEAAQKLPEYAEIVAAIRASKMRVFPVITFAILLTIAAVVLSGGVHTKFFPMWFHHVTMTATFLFNVYTFWVEYRGVKENLLLMTLVDYKVEQLAEESHHG